MVIIQLLSGCDQPEITGETTDKQILETDSLNDEVNEWENDTTTYHSEAKPY
jgi:hypothetical protein